MSDASERTPITELREMLDNRDTRFWDAMVGATADATEPDEILFLSRLRRAALAKEFRDARLRQRPLRVALVGAYSLYPFHEMVEHCLSTSLRPMVLFTGEFDNYMAEALEEGSPLYVFRPDIVVLLPSERRCRYVGSLTDSIEEQRIQARKTAEGLLRICDTIHNGSGADVVVANFIPPAHHDMGAFRNRTLASDWAFRRLVNIEIGTRAGHSVHVLDLEFLAYRRGGLQARDQRLFFESKQPFSPALMADAAHELSHLIRGLTAGPKKVLVLDLDNTLWGGVVGDDGLEGIDLGDTSPRGEAFKAFQAYVAGLRQRGVLLAVCSKNDEERAKEPFKKHPEMVLKLDDLVSFKANWNPKSDNIREIAAELNLGLDSIVFVDDDPVEVDIVRQFVPEVTAIHLTPDPAGLVSQLQDSRLFEPKIITKEDMDRTRQYQSETRRRVILESATDMNFYLSSLEMKAIISDFVALDVPRISQLINKSNQFNLTTRRRSEADVLSLMSDPIYDTFTIRLSDRFGDHGLVTIVVLRRVADVIEVDTWLMSCRVLKRQVEDLTANEIMRRSKGAARVVGRYFPTKRNGMVRDLYSRMGFGKISESADCTEYRASPERYTPHRTQIEVVSTKC